jgi:glycosyltransferase involved in cell wall biosynthesis
MGEGPPRLISAGGLDGPTGGTRYNERVAAEWGVGVEYLPGRWPQPRAEDLDALARMLRRPGDGGPILLDGLVGSAAWPVLAERGRSGAARARVCVIVHLPLPAETGLAPRSQEVLAEAEHRALRAADGVACTSRWAAGDLRRRYGLTDVVVAEPGADVQPVACGSRPPRLLTLAAFSPRKNHRVLLDAMNDPLVGSLEWSALWMGADAEPGARHQLARAASRSACAGRLTVAGAATGAELERVWDGTDLLLLPSLVETYAMVVTEALAHGIPAIVGAGTAAEQTLKGSARRGADDGSVPGAAIDPRDPSGWAQVLHTWLTDPAVRGRWRQAALARRSRLPRWSHAARRLRGLLEGAPAR